MGVEFIKETKKIQALTLQLCNAHEMISRQKINISRLVKELEVESKISQPQSEVSMDICAALADIDADNDAQLTLIENNRSRINSFSQLVNTSVSQIHSASLGKMPLT